MKNDRIVQFIAGWLVLAIFAIALFPHRDLVIQSDIPRQGVVSSRAYIAPISFDVPKSPAQLKEERELAEAKVNAVFEFNNDATARILNEFEQAMHKIADYGTIKARMAQTNSNTELQSLATQANNIQQELSHRLSVTAIHHLSLHPGARDTLRQAFVHLMNEGVSELLLASTPRQVTLYQEFHNLSEVKSLLYTKQDVSLTRNGHEMDINVSRLRPREAVIEDAFASIQLVAVSSQGLQSAFYEALHAFVEPNVFYLDKETDSRRKLMAEQVNPSKGVVVKGMEIVSPGSIVTQDAVEKLQALQQTLQQEDGKRSKLTSGFGQALFVLALTILFCLYLLSQSTKDFGKISHFWAIICVHLLQIVAFFGNDLLIQHLQRQNSFLPEGTDFIWLQPFILAPVLCTVLFHFRVGLVSAIFTSVHLGMQASYDLTVTISAFFICWATILFLHQIRYRYHFILSIILGVVVTTISLTVTLLLRNRLGWTDFWPEGLLGTINVLTTVSICSLLLIHIFEKGFSVTTNLTLMELSDFNHPALKQLSERAPGSFHHSIMVGNLAEKAATRVGANPLLTRVISLYHDIGKSERPAFFTENQKKGENPHDLLDPQMSAAIIRDHVVQGLRLAKEFKIPDLIAAGIPEHHGDNVIHYFYQKAKDKNPGLEISAEAFSYPGPRPRSKETALVMLADGIEATSRSMEDPDAAHLAKLVQDVIQTRLQQDQLRESGLSIHDLEEIEIGFLQSLEGMYHTRIQYPEGVFLTTQQPAVGK